MSKQQVSVTLYIYLNISVHFSIYRRGWESTGSCGGKIKLQQRTKATLFIQLCLHPIEQNRIKNEVKGENKRENPD